MSVIVQTSLNFLIYSLAQQHKSLTDFSVFQSCGYVCFVVYCRINKHDQNTNHLVNGTSGNSSSLLSMNDEISRRAKSVRASFAVR